MLTTRCPHCNTVFRVRSEQLGQRNGRVRCGKCHTPFSALETLSEQPDGTPLNSTSPPVTSPMVAPSALDTASAPAPEPIAQAAPPTPAAAPATVEPRPAPALAAPAVLNQPSLPEPAPLAAADLEPPTPAGDFHIDFDFGSFGEDLAQTPAAASITAIDKASDVPFVKTQVFAAAPDEDEAAIAPPADPPRAELSLIAEPAEPAEAAAVIDAPQPSKNVASLIEDAAEEIRLQGLEDGFTEAAPDTEVVQALLGGAEPTEAFTHEGETVFLEDEFIAPPKKRRGRKILWAVIALLLLSAALAQAAYVFRTQLAQMYPELRAPLEQACGHLQCSVPYPRNPAAIKVQSSDLVPEANQQGQYRLIATLLNMADYPQAWPHLELTLLDRYERALSRRVLSPADWLPNAQRQQAAFSARSEITANIALSSDLPADGYRVYAFYP